MTISISTATEAEFTTGTDDTIAVSPASVPAAVRNTEEALTTALKTKLDGIEAGADVTDAANVAAAGAAMAANNLSDLTNADTALTNLGFGAAGKAIAADATEADVISYLDVKALNTADGFSFSTTIEPDQSFSVTPFAGNSSLFRAASVNAHDHSSINLYPRTGVAFNRTAFGGGSTLTDPFSTTASDATVNVNVSSHNLVVGQTCEFSGASAVGGITIDGQYTVGAVIDGNNFTIEHTSNASSTASGGGTVVYSDSNDRGVTKANSAAVFFAEKENWRTSKNFGQVDAISYAVPVQGVNGDSAGINIGTYKIDGRANNGLGSTLGIEAHANWVDPDFAQLPFAPAAQAPVSITIASPAVFTAAGHGLTTGKGVQFTTTGTLPTGLTTETTYYAIPIDANTFKVASSYANALTDIAINTSASQSGTHSYDIATTITIDSPGVFTVINHGLTTGKGVQLETTGTLPIGLAKEITYYAIPIDADTFSVATTYANAVADVAIATSGSQAGVHSYSVVNNFTPNWEVACVTAYGEGQGDAAGSYGQGDGVGFFAEGRRGNVYSLFAAIEAVTSANATCTWAYSYSLTRKQADIKWGIDNAGTMLHFNSRTDASNYEAGVFRFSSNILQIGTDNSGTGTTREVELIRGGTPFLRSTSTGPQIPTGSSLHFAARGHVSPAADGRITLYNEAFTGFDRLQFGGVGTSHPALKRSSTALQVRLADDSAFSAMAMEYLEITDGITAPATGTGARLYVDTADGDLKVKFADGTVKTIVLDT